MKHGELIEHTMTIPLQEFLGRYQHIEKYHDACKNCKFYGKLWSCPPYDFDISELLGKYSTVQLFAYQMNLSEEYKTLTGTKAELLRVAEEISDEVRLATDPLLRRMEAEHPGSLACYAGNCHLCPRGTCTRLEGKPCRHPKDIRYSLENYGIDLMASANDLFGLPILWMKDNHLPSYYLYLAALLY